MTDSNDSIAEAKQLLRGTTRARRDAIEPAERATRSSALLERATLFEGLATAAVVHTYVGVGSEVQTLPLIEQLLDHGVRVVCPRVAAGNHLEHREIRSTDELVESAIGLLEPDPNCCSEVALATVDLVLVPGLAFTRNGYRLGYGSGYYDRLLAECDTTVVGIALAEQLLDALPREAHDRAVDVVITDSETIHTGARA